MIHPYNSTDTVAAWKDPVYFIREIRFLYDRNLSIAIYDFTMHTVTLLSVNAILLPRYMNGSINLRGLSLRMEMAPSSFKTYELCFICVNEKANASSSLL